MNDFLDEFASTDPRVVSADELAALLDKRMEKITILTGAEVIKASKNPAFKIIKRKGNIDILGNQILHSCHLSRMFRLIHLSSIKEYIQK